MLFLFILLSTLGCLSDQTQQQLDAEPYFDLEGFMQGEIARLDSIAPVVRKTILLNGEEEIKELNEIDFERELNIFLESDINRPAWVGKYTSDTLYSDSSTYQVTYQSLDSTLQTRQLTIVFGQEAAVREVRIQQHTNTILSEGDQYLTYLVDRYYEISTDQSIRTTEGIHSTIRGEFLDPPK